MFPSPTTGTDGSAPTAAPIRGGARRWLRFRARARIWRRVMRSHPALHLTWRLTIGVIGSLVLLGGVVMLVTPGPGIGGVIVGLAVLATEFSWARNLLWRARRYAHRVKARADEKLRARRSAS